MNRPELALKILEQLGVAALVRTGPMSYQPLEPAPDFYRRMFPDEADGSACASPWQHSDMLEFFLSDAENFFDENTDGRINSGVWQEDSLGPGQVFLAEALYLDNTPLLLVRLQKEDYEEKANILQMAREKLLEQRRMRHTLEFYKTKSCYDGMTALYNKQTFMEILKEEIQSAEENNCTLSLIMSDIDNFKRINDNHGHLVGDDVIIAVGQIFRDTLRRRDIAARYGGEEFVVLAPSTSREEARHIAERLRSRIESFSAPDIPPFTVSVGYTVLRPKEDVASFIKRSDDALYEAKALGKNRVCER